MTDFIISFGIPLAYIALAIAIIAAVVFPVIYMIQDFKKARGAFVGVGLLVVLFLICYFLTSDGDYVAADIPVAEGQIKLIEAGIYLFYITLVGSIVAILYSSVSRYFK